MYNAGPFSDGEVRVTTSLVAVQASPTPRRGGEPAQTRSSGASSASASSASVAAKPQAAMPQGAVETKRSPEPESAEHPPAATTPLTPENIESIWSQAVEQLSEMAAQQVRQCQNVAISAPNRLVVTFPAEYTFSKQQCERPEQAARLMRAVAQVTGTPVKIEFAVAEAAMSEQPKAAPARAASQRELISERADHAMVRKAVEMFDGEIIRVAPGDSEV